MFGVSADPSVIRTGHGQRPNRSGPTRDGIKLLNDVDRDDAMKQVSVVLIRDAIRPHGPGSECSAMAPGGLPLRGPGLPRYQSPGRCAGPLKQLRPVRLRHDRVYHTPAVMQSPCRDGWYYLCWRRAVVGGDRKSTGAGRSRLLPQPGGFSGGIPGPAVARLPHSGQASTEPVSSASAVMTEQGSRLYSCDMVAWPPV